MCHFPTSTRWTGAEMLYFAMFDQLDEGSAFFKCTDDPPCEMPVRMIPR